MDDFVSPNMEIEFNKFLEKLDMERDLGKNVIFIETDIKLESTRAFSQYIYDKIRLITLIGERHDLTWKCNKHSITVAEYCKRAVIRNPKCKVLLEYNRGDNPKRIGSEAIRTIYNELEETNNLDKIIPFDSRSYFLGIQGQGDLYSSGFYKYTSLQTIGPTFIEPFFRKLRQEPNLFKMPGKYKPSIINYLEKIYLGDITSSFRYIVNVFGKVPLKQTHQKLKDTWKKVADFFILKIILRNDEIDDYIVVLGEAHYININNILKSVSTQLNYHTGNPGNCINIYQTYRI